MPNQWGSNEPGLGEATSPRLQIAVAVIDHDRVRVSTNLFDEFKVGFDKATSDAANLAFAQTLHNLAKEVADRQPDEALDPDDPADRQRLEESLVLDEGDAQDYLDQLAEIGRGLRRDLDGGLVAKLQEYGFLQEEVAGEPALTFIETVPIQWEVMYEGGLLEDTDWEKFWGFRTPISHWLGGSRPEDIRLQQGFFSATAEDLNFAGREVSVLAHRLASRVPHASLDKVFRDLVESSLREELHKDEIEISNWWKGCKDEWLTCWLEAVASTERGRSQQKLRLLVGALRANLHRNLLHFACHCESSTTTKFLTRLDMTVAGEPIELKAGDLSAPDVKRDFKPTDHGPLIFLNACGTSAHGALHEAPGLPEPWIKSQGALAVVSTLCPVPDYFAHAFALKFYDFLFEALEKPDDSEARRRSSLREALLDTRRYFMETYNNPLGLAYVLYGFQNVRVLADFVGERRTS